MYIGKLANYSSAHSTQAYSKCLHAFGLNLRTLALAFLVLTNVTPTPLSLSMSLLPAGDSESNALEKELQQKQSVGCSLRSSVDPGMALL